MHWTQDLVSVTAINGAPNQQQKCPHMGGSHELNEMEPTHTTRGR